MATARSRAATEHDHASRTRRPARSSARCRSSPPTRCARSPSAAAPPSRPGRRSASRAARACCAAPRSGCSTTSERVIDTIVSETGKTHEDALLAEIGYVASAFGFWAKNAPEYLADEKVRSANPFVLGRKLVVRYAPLGLVGVIGPWNYPLSNSFGDCIPALAAGNAVILKPSRGHAADLAADGRGDARVRPARGRLPGRDRPAARPGQALIDEVDMVMFTGSTATGKKVMERAARTLTPVSLELGGKDPMIVLADADLERAANAATYYSMQNGGQTCISVERVYVEAPVYDEFVAKVTEKVKALRQGAPGRARHASTSARSRSRSSSTSSRATSTPPREAGATVLTGGHARTRRRALLRADRARRRRPLDGVHDRGDVRPDAADHARRRRRGGGQARQRLRRTGSPRRCGRRTPRAARRSRAGSRPARSASTTRSSTTSRSSCRWAAGRPPGSARATAPAGSASTRASSRCW